MYEVKGKDLTRCFLFTFQQSVYVKCFHCKLYQTSNITSLAEQFAKSKVNTSSYYKQK